MWFSSVQVHISLLRWWGVELVIFYKCIVAVMCGGEDIGREWNRGYMSLSVWKLGTLKLSTNFIRFLLLNSKQRQNYVHSRRLIGRPRSVIRTNYTKYISGPTSRLMSTHSPWWSQGPWVWIHRQNDIGKISCPGTKPRSLRSDGNSYILGVTQVMFHLWRSAKIHIIGRPNRKTRPIRHKP